MTPVAAAALSVALFVAALAAARWLHRRLPPPDAPSDRHDQLTRQLRLAREQSVARTAALNRELERLRTGARWRDDR